MNPFKDREDAMMWYYNTHSMPESPLPQSPQNIIDYSPPQQWQLQDFIPMQPLPTEPMPTEPFREIVSKEPLVSYFGTGQAVPLGWQLTDITNYNMLYNDLKDTPVALGPPGEIPDAWKENPYLSEFGENPWPEYEDAEGFKEEAMQPFKRGPDGITPVWSWEIGDVENNSSTPPLSGLPIIPISDSTTTPLPDSGLLAPEEYIPETPDYSSFPPLDSYDFSGFESYVDSLPAGNHSYEGVIQDYIGRPLSPEESAMLSPEYSKLGEIRNLFGEPEDYTSNMPMIDPGEPSPPPNSDGLMGIVGGGIIDPGPVFDMQTAEGYEAYLNSL